MKTLILFRHGKSDWDADYEVDHDRPLAERGRAAASLMGRYLTALHQIPDSVVTSSAIRANETVYLAAEEGRWSCPIETAEELYGASPEDVLQLIRACDDSIVRLLLAGHEPTWSELTGMLIGEADIQFPTAAMVRIDFGIERWTDADFGRGTLVWFVSPKLLRRIGWSGQDRL